MITDQNVLTEEGKMFSPSYYMYLLNLSPIDMS